MKTNKKTKRQALIAISLICGILSCFLFQKPFFKGPEKAAGFFNEKNYFVPLKISAFSRANIPQLDVEIENKNISTKLDLGWGGGIRVPPEIFQTLKNKSFIRKEDSFGLRGKTYECSIYEVPEIHIGKMKIFPMRIAEENLEFVEDGILKKGERDIPEDSLGRLGWYVFAPFNVLIDCDHYAIVICDSLKTLEQQGYPIKTFTEAPLLLDRDSIDFEALTEAGPLRCVLDTGATWNLLNKDLQKQAQDHRHIDLDHTHGRLHEFNPENEDLLVFNTEERWETKTFQVSGQEFGPVNFVRMQSPVGLDAVLGMEFIDNHLIFIDFQNKKIYFSKLPEERSFLNRVYDFFKNRASS